MVFIHHTVLHPDGLLQIVPPLSLRYAVRNDALPSQPGHCEGETTEGSESPKQSVDEMHEGISSTTRFFALTDCFKSSLRYRSGTLFAMTRYFWDHPVQIASLREEITNDSEKSKRSNPLMKCTNGVHPPPGSSPGWIASHRTSAAAPVRCSQ